MTARSRAAVSPASTRLISVSTSAGIPACLGGVAIEVWVAASIVAPPGGGAVVVAAGAGALLSQAAASSAVA